MKINLNSVQMGTAYEADFQEGTWTFAMNPGFEVMAGEFAIISKKEYEAIIEIIKKL